MVRLLEIATDSAMNYYISKNMVDYVNEITRLFPPPLGSNDMQSYEHCRQANSETSNQFSNMSGTTSNMNWQKPRESAQYFSMTGSTANLNWQKPRESGQYSNMSGGTASNMNWQKPRESAQYSNMSGSTSNANWPKPRESAQYSNMTDTTSNMNWQRPRELGHYSNMTDTMNWQMQRESEQYSNMAEASCNINWQTPKRSSTPIQSPPMNSWSNQNTSQQRPGRNTRIHQNWTPIPCPTYQQSSSPISSPTWDASYNANSRPNWNTTPVVSPVWDTSFEPPITGHLNSRQNRFTKPMTSPDWENSRNTTPVQQRDKKPILSQNWELMPARDQTRSWDRTPASSQSWDRASNSTQRLSDGSSDRENNPELSAMGSSGFGSQNNIRQPPLYKREKVAPLTPANYHNITPPHQYDTQEKAFVPRMNAPDTQDKDLAPWNDGQTQTSPVARSAHPNHEVVPLYVKDGCKFCKMNGETQAFYSKHPLKARIDGRMVVTCPVLRAHVCSVCSATGNNAHTLTYCPTLRIKNKGNPIPSTTIALKSTKIKSNGKRRF